MEGSLMVFNIRATTRRGRWLSLLLPAVVVFGVPVAFLVPAPRVISPQPNTSHFWAAKTATGAGGALALDTSALPGDLIPMEAWWAAMPPALPAASTAVPRQVSVLGVPPWWDAPFPAAPLPVPPTAQAWPIQPRYPLAGRRGHHRVYFMATANPQTGKAVASPVRFWIGYGGPFDNVPPRSLPARTAWTRLQNCFNKQYPAGGGIGATKVNDWVAAGFGTPAGGPARPNPAFHAAAFAALPAPLEPAADQYSEYDVDVHRSPSATRGTRRLVRNDRTGELYYSDDHYCTFRQI
ncbi:ribonuclease domain-containing protein [Streptomyces sp. NPDC002225]|uniref:ribonuclease domain-containing protein n=1 Tax=Streptomyces sp. NPDC002225 TaxID=3154413 RepID=UPI00332F5BB0